MHAKYFAAARTSLLSQPHTTTPSPRTLSRHLEVRGCGSDTHHVQNESEHAWFGWNREWLACFACTQLCTAFSRLCVQQSDLSGSRISLFISTARSVFELPCASANAEVCTGGRNPPRYDIHISTHPSTCVRGPLGPNLSIHLRASLYGIQQDHRCQRALSIRSGLLWGCHHSSTAGSTRTPTQEEAACHKKTCRKLSHELDTIPCWRSVHTQRPKSPVM